MKKFIFESSVTFSAFFLAYNKAYNKGSLLLLLSASLNKDFAEKNIYPNKKVHKFFYTILNSI